MDCYNEFQGFKYLKVSTIDEVINSKQHILNVLKASNVDDQTFQDISLVFSKLEYWLQYYEKTKNIRTVIPSRSDFEKKFNDALKTNEVAKEIIKGWLVNQSSNGKHQPQPNKNWIASMKNVSDNLTWLKDNVSQVSYWYLLNVKEKENLDSLIQKIFNVTLDSE